jgi:hypothetical protein
VPFSLDSGPTRGRRANEAELGPLVIDESEANVGEVDMVQTVAGLHGDPFTLEGMTNGDHGAVPADSSRRCDLANLAAAHQLHAHLRDAGDVHVQHAARAVDLRVRGFADLALLLQHGGPAYAGHRPGQLPLLSPLSWPIRSTSARPSRMAYSLDAAGQARLDLYFDGIGTILRRRDRRESFALYAAGLFGDSERKSVEPIAARACADPELCNAYHDRLLHFLGVAPWSDAQVSHYAAGYGVSAMTAHEPVTDWIVDDTGFPKQGDESPGVQRQYSGTLGKTGNCQVAVSMTIATRTMHLPLDMDLYLPQSWDDDRAPAGLRTPPTTSGIGPSGASHSNSSTQRQGRRPARIDARRQRLRRRRRVPRRRVGTGLRLRGRRQVHTRVVIVCHDGSETDVMNVETAADVIGARSYRTMTWRQSSRRALSARFAQVRVRVVTGQNTRRDEQWLVIEKADREGPVEHSCSRHSRSRCRSSTGPTRQAALAYRARV